MYQTRKKRAEGDSRAGGVEVTYTLPAQSWMLFPDDVVRPHHIYCQDCISPPIRFSCSDICIFLFFANDFSSLFMLPPHLRSTGL